METGLLLILIHASSPSCWPPHVFVRVNSLGEGVCPIRHRGISIVKKGRCTYIQFMTTKTIPLAKRPVDPDILGGYTDGMGILVAMQKAGKKAAKREATPQPRKNDVKSLAASALPQQGKKEAKVPAKPLKPALRSAKKPSRPEEISSPRVRRKP